MFPYKAAVMLFLWRKDTFTPSLIALFQYYTKWRRVFEESNRDGLANSFYCLQLKKRCIDNWMLYAGKYILLYAGKYILQCVVMICFIVTHLAFKTNSGNSRSLST